MERYNSFSKLKERSTSVEPVSSVSAKDTDVINFIDLLKASVVPTQPSTAIPSRNLSAVNPIKNAR
ncbi:hypothetical protein SAMN05421780_1023 [Flexibacter flexilis DSM 6793]|uniref:Uncharacterized protein n=1 Tax=Flexibacter flexilis DSM 6793 TaxID=927664 RepID=A0A1I1F158_9BACT|nr:hypothetical protein [Flexibacter flexilis]SFB93054.1 hypothetical protein SAMN05421780_1023 [Flexibacter flexilis DSM 6793]